MACQNAFAPAWSNSFTLNCKILQEFFGLDTKNFAGKAQGNLLKSFKQALLLKAQHGGQYFIKKMHLKKNLMTFKYLYWQNL